jgi:YesN/AraC family two-component response regulator
LKVLILEDESIIRDYFTSLVISIPGVTDVESAHSGKEALALLQSFIPDLVLLDYDLGGKNMNGLQLGMEIIKQAPHAKTVLISGYQPKHFSDQSFQPDGFLLKPVDKEQFIALVKGFLGDITFG